MSDKRISELSDGAPAQTGDTFPIERSGTANFRLTLSNVLTLISTYAFPSLNTTTLTTTGATSLGPTTLNNPVTANGSTGSSTTTQVLASRGPTLSPQWVDAFPVGGIIMWSGSTIPSGWALCNGASGTPDLRNRFIVGSGSTWSTGSTGGNNDAVVVAHTHTITDPGHHHSNAPGTLIQLDGPANYPSGYDNAGTTGDATTGITIDSAGVSATYANMPLYYALAFIMKLAY